MSCTEKCWTPVECPDHGELLWPRGRSAPLGMTSCCPKDNYLTTNPCHLFGAHDSDRHYFDPEGWESHESVCQECNPSLEDEASA